jgi:2-polyprenyl-3-methyl-5-hydroxy-6-metoxy-1,4-benzoquinol methylase
LDKHTDLLVKLERNRAEWLHEKVPIHHWLDNSSRILDVGSGIGDIATKLNEL